MMLVIFMGICKIIPIYKYRQKDFSKITFILVLLSFVKLLTIYFYFVIYLFLIYFVYCSKFDMKSYKNVFKYKKPSLGIHVYETNKVCINMKQI